MLCQLVGHREEHWFGDGTLNAGKLQDHIMREVTIQCFQLELFALEKALQTLPFGSEFRLAPVFQHKANDERRQPAFGAVLRDGGDAL